MKTSQVSKDLVATDYPFLSVCAPTYSVEFYIFIYLTFFVLPLINFDILNGVDTK